MVDHLARPDVSSPDVSGHLLALLSMAERRLGAAMADRMGPHGVALRGSYARLLHILPAGGARPSELAQGWISKQAVGKRIQEMVEAGLVSVDEDPSDGRATIIRRTAAGDRVLALTRRELAGLEAELAREVGERRYGTFRAVLAELASV